MFSQSIASDFEAKSDFSGYERILIHLRPDHSPIIVGQNEKTKIATTIGTKIKNDDDHDEDRWFQFHVISDKGKDYGKDKEASICSSSLP